MHPPDRIRTARLLLRRWRLEDAPSLKVALDASLGHLVPWIPWATGEPTPLAELEARLAGYVADFDAGRAWIYGIFPPDESAVLGGVGLYPRTEDGRVPFAAADRVELGYWLRADVTGRGYATEATRAALDLALTLPGMTCVDLRCDPRNAPSIAVARRLGFRHARTVLEQPAASGRPAEETMVWEHPASPGAPTA